MERLSINSFFTWGREEVKWIMSDEQEALWTDRYEWPVTGSYVIAVDEVGKEHNALVTANWGAKEHCKTAGPTINLLYVSDDETKTDQYGRQIDRHMSSTMHARQGGCVHGR